MASAALASLAAPPDGSGKVLPPLVLADGMTAGTEARGGQGQDPVMAEADAQSPPVSPTGHGSASANLASSSSEGGRSTPISPAKGPASKARRSKPPPSAAKAESVAAMLAMAPCPQYLDEQRKMQDLPAPWMAQEWAPLPGPLPWLESQTNALPLPLPVQKP